MRVWKKALAMFLVLILTVSMMAIPANAADVLEIALTTSSDIVKAGDEFTAKLMVNGNTTGFTALTIFIYYDKSVLNCSEAWESEEWDDGKGRGESYSCQSNPNDQSSDHFNEIYPSDKWGLASFGYTVSKGEDMTFKGFTATNTAIADLTFTVTGNLEDCETPISLVIVSAMAAGNEDILEGEKVTSTGATVTIDGVTPELDLVTLTENDEAVPAAGVKVDGTNGHTIQATATSKQGTNLTEKVTWSVDPAGKGVEVFSAGVVKVDPKAVAGTYTIKADGISNVSQGTNSADLVITREASKATSIKFFDGSRPITSTDASGVFTDIIGIPSAGSDANERTYKAISYDQFGAVFAELSVSGSGGGEIEVANGKVTVANSVADEATVTLSATQGTASATLKVIARKVTVDWTKVTAKDAITYGETAGSAITLPSGGTTATAYTSTGGTATLNGTLAVESASATPDVTTGEAKYSIEVSFTVTSAGDYEGQVFKKVYDVKVNPRDISNVTTDPDFGGTTPRSYDYTGSKIMPDVTVKDLNKTLTKDTDYTIEYGENTTVGNGTITLKAVPKGNYTGQKVLTFKIAAARATLDLTGVDLTKTVYANDSKNESIGKLGEYAPNELTATFTVAGQDAPETVTLTPTWVADQAETAFEIKGEATYTYHIQSLAVKSIARMATTDENFNVDTSDVMFTVVVDPVVATQTLDKHEDSVRKSKIIDTQEMTPEAVVTSLPTTAAVSYTAGSGAAATSYAISGWNLVNENGTRTELTLTGLQDIAKKVSDNGEETITLEPIYSTTPEEWATLGDKPTFELTITGKTPAEITIGGTQPSIPYGGTVTTPTISGTTEAEDGTPMALPSTTKFNYTYKGTGSTVYNESTTAPTNAGTYEVTVVLDDATYSGRKTMPFTIEARGLDAPGVTIGTITDQDFTGSEIEPVPSITDTGAVITRNDYTVTWTNNLKAGTNTAIATITGKNNYTGRIERKFTIKPKDLSTGGIEISLSPSEYTFSGEACEPEVTVTFGNLLLTKGTDYDVEYSGNLNAGNAATVTIKATAGGNYSEETSKTFTIKSAKVPGSVKIKSDTEKIETGTELTADISQLFPDFTSVGATPPTVTYEWKKGNTVLGTGSSYTVAVGDEDATITLKVTVSGNYEGEKESSVVVGKNVIPDTATVGLEMTAKKTSEGVMLIATVTVSGTGITMQDLMENYLICWYNDGVERTFCSFGLDGVVEISVRPEDIGSVITCKMIPNDEGSEFTDEVIATNTEGHPDDGTAADGKLNGIGGFVVPDMTVPGSPTNVTATASNDTITASWTAPADDGNSPILSYTVSLVDENRAIRFTQTVTGTSCTFTNVPEGNYTVIVSATNAIGTGFRSFESNTVTATRPQTNVRPSRPSGNTSQTTTTRPISNGGNSNGGGTSKRYGVSVPTYQNGTISLSKTNAVANETVYITVSPKAGCALESLRVLDQNGKEINLVKSAGRYAFTMPVGDVKIEASFSGEPTQTTQTSSFPFADASNSWARDAIAWAYENGYINGTSATTFNPNGNITRQQMWMILARLSGQRPSSMDEARQWAMSNGISDGTNGPNAMSRQQLVTFLYRYAQQNGYSLTGSAELNTYPDGGKVATYAQEALAWAVSNGIVAGTSSGTLNPEGTATRAQFATILQRFYNGVVA